MRPCGLLCGALAVGRREKGKCTAPKLSLCPLDQADCGISVRVLRDDTKISIEP